MYKFCIEKIIIAVVIFGLSTVSAEVPKSHLVEAEVLLKSLAHDTKTGDIKIYLWQLPGNDTNVIEWNEDVSDYTDEGFVREGTLSIANGGKITHRKVGKVVESGKWKIWLLGDKQKIIKVKLTPDTVSLENPALYIDTVYMQEKIICKETPKEKIEAIFVKFPGKVPFWMEVQTSMSSKGSMNSYVITYDERSPCIAQKERQEKDISQLKKDNKMSQNIQQPIGNQNVNINLNDELSVMYNTFDNPAGGMNTGSEIYTVQQNGKQCRYEYSVGMVSGAIIDKCTGKVYNFNIKDENFNFLPYKIPAYIDPFFYMKAYTLMTNKDHTEGSTVMSKHNSKGIKIYCLQDKSICKTEKEVLSYIVGPAPIQKVISNPKCTFYTVVTVPQLNVRDRPSKPSNIIGIVNKGDSVCIYEFSGKWGKVIGQSDIGWISGKYLKANTSVVKTTNNINNCSTLKNKLWDGIDDSFSYSDYIGAYESDIKIYDTLYSDCKDTEYKLTRKEYLQKINELDIKIDEIKKEMVPVIKIKSDTGAARNALTGWGPNGDKPGPDWRP